MTHLRPLPGTPHDAPSSHPYVSIITVATRSRDAIQRDIARNDDVQPMPGWLGKAMLCGRCSSCAYLRCSQQRTPRNRWSLFSPPVEGRRMSSAWLDP